jgi:hypothetical protein
MKSCTFWNITPYIPLKFNRRFGGTCHLTSNELHGVISQKIEEYFITTAVRTSQNGHDTLK